jgi:DNA-binding beta-propeller fold protein YncE
MRGAEIKRRRGIAAATVLIATVTFSLWTLHRQTKLESASGSPLGSPRLISIQELPDFGEMCAPEPPSHSPSVVAALEQKSLFAVFNETRAYAASQEGGETADVTRPPVRTIKDTYPIYSSVAVDPLRDEVVLQDTNLFGIKIFNRLDNTPSDAESTKPKRVIQGPKTLNEYNNGLYIDPKTGNIHSVAMDTADSMIVFPGGADGDIAPIRKLNTPHRNFATAANEDKGEIYITIQYPPKVMVYRKEANGDEKPLRVLEGEHTKLYDTHGIALDVRKNLMFVGTWGNASDHKVAGTGKFYPPSINVYPLDASGDTAPLRVIQGPKTQLDWAGGMSLDTENGNLYVANDVGNSILVFHETDQGDVAPARIIKGSKTGLSHPAGISVDLKNKEVWVSNMGNSSATCYSLTASGDATPLRTIRSAPSGRTSVKFGKPQAVAYDSKREQYLVPN